MVANYKFYFFYYKGIELWLATSVNLVFFSLSLNGKPDD